MLKFNLKNLILILFSLVMFAGAASARSHKKGPSVRQTKKVAKSPKMAIDPQVARLLFMADENAEKLDAYTQELLKISSLSAWQRWVQNKDVTKVKQAFSNEMQKHLGIIAEIFKIRSHKGRLLQYQEFEFQNLLRKSDYLLSLEFSRDSLVYARKNKDFSASFGKTLISYNEQRFHYDRKTIEMKL
ncbi:hypothetical protein D3C87_1204260 [compost metagenome]